MERLPHMEIKLMFTRSSACTIFSGSQRRKLGLTNPQGKMNISVKTFAVPAVCADRTCLQSQTELNTGSARHIFVVQHKLHDSSSVTLPPPGVCMNKRRSQALRVTSTHALHSYHSVMHMHSSFKVLLNTTGPAFMTPRKNR